MKELLVNRWKTPDGTILQSKYRHDYVSHTDKNGKTYAIDGGHDYCRVVGDFNDLENLCLYEGDDFEEIRKYLVRGTFDKDGNRIWIPLKDMSVDHLNNCIKYNIGLGYDEDCLMNRMYRKELEFRNK